MANDSVITQQKLKEYHETYVYPFLNGISTKGDQAFVPCGKIEGFMRTTAPKGYLVCDGTEYLKSAYPSLAALLASVDTAQSTTNFAGSDSDHFKVPDLRGEFLRGTGTNSHTNQGNGANVGVHQDATEMPSIYIDNNQQAICAQNNNTSGYNTVTNQDKSIPGTTGTGRYIKFTNEWSGGANEQRRYTARPTNTSVLYCIAYQDLYLTPGHTYSTDEQVVGTWIDGKPVYEKTIIDTLPTTTHDYNFDSKFIPLNAQIDSVVDISSFVSNQDSTVEILMPFVYPRTDGMSMCTVYVNLNSASSDRKNTLQILNNYSSWSGRRVVIKVRYTKTTDTV